MIPQYYTYHFQFGFSKQKSCGLWKQNVHPESIANKFKYESPTSNIKREGKNILSSLSPPVAFLQGINTLGFEGAWAPMKHGPSLSPPEPWTEPSWAWTAGSGWLSRLCSASQKYPPHASFYKSLSFSCSHQLPHFYIQKRESNNPHSPQLLLQWLLAEVSTAAFITLWALLSQRPTYVLIFAM